jgi:hypothetical protein
MWHQIYNKSMSSQMLPEDAELLRRAAIIVDEERQKSFALGMSVFYRDDAGRYVEELPDGRIFEIRLIDGADRHSNSERIRELTPVYA